MALARLPHCELHYVRRGQGEPLLLIMGMSGSHLHWGEPFLRELERDFEVIAYDHRGIGASSRVHDPFTIVDLADDAAALLDVLQLDSVHVMGLSMGGMVAQELALRHPERVRTLILGATYAGGEGGSLTEPAVLEELTTPMVSGDRAAAVRAAWEVNVSPALAGQAERFGEFEQIARQAPAAVAVIMAQARAIASHDTSARLAEIGAPTLVVHGTADRMLASTNGQAIAERIPGAHLELLDGVGHLFTWERPTEVAELVRDHARTATPRSRT